MPQSFLQSMVINSFNGQVTDEGSRANTDISFWLPQYTEADYYFLGMYGTNNYNNPPTSGQQFVYKAINAKDQPPCLIRPVGFTQVWTCIGDDQPSNLGIYNLVAPPGYIALGTIAVPNFNTPPKLSDYPNLMCVRQDLCQQYSLNLADSIWTDVGSCAPMDVSIWRLPNSCGCIATVDRTGYPDQVSAWDIMPSSL